MPLESHLPFVHRFDFYGPAFARWLQDQNDGRPVRFEKVEPGDEQILEDREQRELDAVPSFLALSDDEEASDEPETP